MAERIYRNINGKQKPKKKVRAAGIAAICIIGGLIVVLGAVGIISGWNGDGHKRISAAIEENTQLKQQIDELNREIERLNGEVARVEGELSERPTLEPTDAPSDGALGAQNPEPTMISPRNYQD